jgi:hypothetical protein
MEEAIPPEIFNRREIMLPHEFLELITELLYKWVIITPVHTYHKFTTRLIEVFSVLVILLFQMKN